MWIDSNGKRAMLTLNRVPDVTLVYGRSREAVFGPVFTPGCGDAEPSIPPNTDVSAAFTRLLGTRWFTLGLAVLLIMPTVGGLACGAELSDNGDPKGFSPQVVLPPENNLPPLESRYFPDRLHAFVWRNWNAVEPAKLAKILHTSVDNVQALAASMGLPPDAAVGPEMRARGYITLLRRNWHLLPYDQLMELVEMTPQRLGRRLQRRMRFGAEAQMRALALPCAGRSGPASRGRDTAARWRRFSATKSTGRPSRDSLSCDN